MPFIVTDIQNNRYWIESNCKLVNRNRIELWNLSQYPALMYNNAMGEYLWVLNDNANCLMLPVKSVLRDFKYIKPVKKCKHTHTQNKYIEIYFIVSKIYVAYIPNKLKYICIVHLYLSFWNIFSNKTKIFDVKCAIYINL